MMKKTFTLIAIMLLLATQMFAQKLSYQAVIRNSNNELVYNATLTVEVSILGPSQNVLYSQTIQNVTSNQNGLITIQIGDDSPAWRAINWSDATIRSVIKDGTTTVATVNSAVSAVPLAIQTLNGSNGERVQADWEETDQNSPAFIQNKPTIPAAPDLSGYVTNEQLQNAGYLRYESQSLSDVAAYGNDAGSRQLKGLADPTDAQDAVTLSYLTTQLNALQQQLAQLGQVVAAQQAVIDSLTNGGGGNAPVTPTTFTCGDNLIDGSNSYTTHQFGSQCWMTQNLRKVNYPEILSACPDGWHLPNNDDWNTLGSSLTSSSVNFDNGDYWASNTMPWQDADGNSFTLFISPASVRSNSVSITNNGIACEVNDALNGDCRINDYALSVRCVREETSGSDTTGGPTTAQAPSVTSSSADLISENEATLFAYVSNPDNVTITSKGFEYKVSGSANYTTAECYVNSQDDNGFGIYAPLTGLTAGTEYTYRAFVTTAEGTSYGSEGTFTTTTAVTPTTFTCGDNLIDGSNSYTTHQFGSQCWMTQNLRNASGSDRIYYPEVLTACPDGWHLPSQDEWLTLGNYLPSYSESFGKSYYMTTNATMPWQDGDGNAYTLMVRPAYVDNNNSVSIFNSGVACEFSDIVNGVCCLDDCGFAVRCVREETGGSDTTGGPTTAQAPSVTSSSADLISENKATLFAYVSNPDNVTVTSKGFEYKVSGSANYTTAECYVNSQDDNGFGIYAPLTGLTAGTEYTYRAFVTTAEGTIYGSEGTFTTTEDSASCSSLGDLIGQHGNVLRFPINDYSADKINASASGYLVYYNSHDNIWSPCLEVTKSAYDNLVNINDSLVFECVIQFNMLQDYAGQTVKIYPYLILVGCNDDRSWIPSYSVDLVVPTINTSASVGDILLEDNSWVSPNDFDTTSMTAKGVIFHVDETGQHGWAVNLQDEGQSASFQWSTIEEDIADLPNCYDSNTDTAGYQNTRAILQAGDATTYPAANTVSFVDGWYLPAIGQLAVLMQNFEDVNASLGRVNGIAIDGFWYYSSSEIGSSGAWSVYYDEHIINWGRKSTSLKVRSVRSF